MKKLLAILLVTVMISQPNPLNAAVSAGAAGGIAVGACCFGWLCAHYQNAETLCHYVQSKCGCPCISDNEYAVRAAAQDITFAGPCCGPARRDNLELAGLYLYPDLVALQQRENGENCDGKCLSCSFGVNHDVARLGKYLGISYGVDGIDVKGNRYDFKREADYKPTGKYLILEPKPFQRGDLVGAQRVSGKFVGGQVQPQVPEMSRDGSPDVGRMERPFSAPIYTQVESVALLPVVSRSSQAAAVAPAPESPAVSEATPSPGSTPPDGSPVTQQRAPAFPETPRRLSRSLPAGTRTVSPSTLVTQMQNEQTEKHQ